LNRLRAADSAARSRFNRTGSSGPAGPACRLARLGPVLSEASRRPGRPPGPLRPAAGRFDRDGARPPALTTGLFPAAACGPFLRARSGGAARPKIPQPAFYYHTAVQVATVTLDYSGKRPAVHRHLVVLEDAE
jgi:hypothetical protein